MPTAQINARIDADAKTAGDASFASAGYSPTRVVRLVWDFAGRHRHDAAAVRELLESLEEKEGDDAQTAERIRIAESGPGIYRQALEALGAFPDRAAAQLDYDELLAQASFEKMAERGLS
ncbi:hypothetical protein [Arabiibacter massiliensis]|uniref:hypothetical protein n=1 Tax=Arabiibacter massiliensis TaxID=1870985 RepID=UPI0009BA490E|nr:hypothetical protein [Arabiibacter massiliensis]